MIWPLEGSNTNVEIEATLPEGASGKDGMRKIVCLGDSITFGEFMSTDLVWPTLLREQLPDCRIINAGVCGDTTRLGLERFPRDVQQREPHTVLLQFGLNDFNCWDTDGGLPRVSRHAFLANLREMVDRCFRFGVRDVRILTPHPIPIGVDGGASEEAALAIMLAGFPMKMVVPVHELVAGDLTLEDGIHLNERGHREYARVIGGQL